MPSSARSRNAVLRALIPAGIAIGLFTCAGMWIVPLRLCFSPGGSWYTPAYLPEENFYAQRMQPLMPGATPTNTLNGICVPEARSPFYLEDILRFFMTLFRCDDVISVFWVWRVLYPVALGALLAVLLKVCLPRTRPPFGGHLQAVIAGAALPFLIVASMYWNYPGIPYSTIQRIPTCIEFPVAILLAIFCVRFADQRTWGRGLWVIGTLGALTYLRFYAAAPWSLAVGILMLYLLLTRQLPLRVFLLMAAAGIVCVLPIVRDIHANAQLPGYQEFLGRYFPARDYAVHMRWRSDLVLAIAFLGSAPVLKGGRRGLAAAAGATMALLPFVIGLPPTLRKETLLADRFGSFYLIAMVLAIAALIGERTRAWRGKAGLRSARCVGAVAAAIGLACAVTVAAYSSYSGVTENLDGQYPSLISDSRYLVAYDWVRGHTPPESLFIVDDGFDWSHAPRDPERYFLHLQQFQANGDLFSIVARRRRLFTETMAGTCVMSNEQAESIELLQRGTLGRPTDPDQYEAALQRWHPDYIFWRKHLPPVLRRAPPAAIGRGNAAALIPRREVVYRDEHCEIWKLNY